MSARALILALFVVGCAHKPVAVAPKAARPTVTTPKLAVTTPPEIFPTFHDVARGFPGSLERPSRMELCPIDNAIFVCGGDRMIMLKGRDLVADDMLAVGLPHDEHGRIDGWVDDISGHFPDDAWLRLQHDHGVREFSY